MKTLFPKKKNKNTETDNFPRVTRNDFFNLNAGNIISFPDSRNYKKHIDLQMPQFDAIASNFPFIQQEDIPNASLTAFFRKQFETKQQAFLKDSNFKINERSDYFTYCVYNSIRFLKDSGFLSFITSNAWLGKDYGFQFKRFMLDNFHIKYVVKSNAEHWFKNSQVSTIFIVLQKGFNDSATKFITIDFKLTEYFTQNDIHQQLSEIEDFYTNIDNCDNPKNTNWKQDNNFKDLYKNSSMPASVCIVPKIKLLESIENNENWAQFFISANLFETVNALLSPVYPNITDVFRGERTGWNPMFVIPENEAASSAVENDYLMPYIKSPSELRQIEFDGNYSHRLFVCAAPFAELPDGAKAWVNRFENAMNKNASQTIKEACAGHKPYWYSLRPKQATIIMPINPYMRFFFSFSKTPFTIDQRLIAMTTKEGYSVELIAALLNSVITFLTLEMRGTSRNLGALDLNADYLKHLKILNPDLISEQQKSEILAAFHPLKHRTIETIFDEIKKPDRINFDKTIFKCFGIGENLLDDVYSLLTASVFDRVSMQER